MRKIVLGVVAIAGALMTAAGVWAAEHPLAFAQRGWTAYSPLASDSSVPGFGPPWWSLVMTVTGALAAGAALALLFAMSVRSRAFTDQEIGSAPPDQVP